jgi:hypothetical protein
MADQTKWPAAMRAPLAGGLTGSRRKCRRRVLILFIASFTSKPKNFRQLQELHYVHLALAAFEPRLIPSSVTEAGARSLPAINRNLSRWREPKLGRAMTFHLANSSN